jgi:hypothetical protein
MPLSLRRCATVEVLILTPIATQRALIFFTSRLTAMRTGSSRSRLHVLFSAHALRCSAIG